MTLLTADELSLIEDATREALGHAVEEPQIYRVGRLTADGTREKKSPTVGHVWVRPYTDDDNQRSAIEALNVDYDPEELIFNDFVWCVGYPSGLRITGHAPGSAAFRGDVPVRPQRLVDQSQLNMGLMQPTQPASMRVRVSAAQYIVDDTLYPTAARETADFSAYLPSTPGNAVGVLVEWNPVGAAFVYTASAEFTAQPIQQALRAGLLPVSLTYFCCGWVYLAYGQTSIQRFDILPEQHIISQGGGLNGCVKTVIDKPTVLPANHACIVPYALEIAPGASLDIVGDLYIVNLDSLI